MIMDQDIKRDIRLIIVWAYSALAAAVGGIGTALGAVLGGQAIGAINFTSRQLGAIAIGGAVTAVAAYLRNSPLPKID